jgi:hypothetical protein
MKRLTSPGLPALLSRTAVVMIGAVASVLVAGCASTPATPSAAAMPAPQSVAFLEPADGAVVHSPFLVRFGVTGMQVQPAGTMTADTGHHHLLINADNIPAMAAIPVDAQHMHFGKGQTETMLTLPPGKYTLTMQFGNGVHQAYGPAMNRTISVTVN